MRDKEIGQRIVPIVPDEDRTFGMDAMFPTAKIYNPNGQHYKSVDRELLLAYKESAQGQILHEGISEAGAMAAFTAAGSSYATHGEPMIPFYIFYSMFGFQRTGDSIWAMADQLARGFLIGATAGRTTLTGEGLQHADGHSPLLAATNPAVVHYDPAYAYEIAHIVQDGLERMYGEGNDARRANVIYYLTVYNEPIVQPDGAGGRRRRGHPARASTTSPRRRGLDDEPARAAARLRRRRAVGARGAAAARRGLGRGRRRLVGDLVERAAPRRPRRRGAGTSCTPTRQPRMPYVTDKLAGRRGPGRRGVATTCAPCQDQIRAVGARRLPRRSAPTASASPTPAPAARRFFHIDGQSVVVQTLQLLAERGEVDADVPASGGREVPPRRRHRRHVAATRAARADAPQLTYAVWPGPCPGAGPRASAPPHRRRSL